MNLLLRHRLTSGLFILLSLIYLASAVFTKPAEATLEKYSISASQAILLGLTIALPYVIIWFIALVGYLRFKSYTDGIRGSRDGEAFSVMAKGLFLLSIWLPLSAVLSVAATHLYRDNPSYTPTLVIMLNYINLAIIIPAFYLINTGSKKLLKLVKTAASAVPQKYMILYIAFSALYVWLTLEDSARWAPTDSVRVASYYLPDWLIVTTIVIPRLIMWFLGIQAVHYLYVYRKKVKGKIYKVALAGLARGIGAVVVATILLRCFQSLSSPIGNLSLAVLLLVIYLLLIALGIGYLIIARGAKKLQKIEEL